MTFKQSQLADLPDHATAHRSFGRAAGMLYLVMSLAAGLSLGLAASEAKAAADGSTTPMSDADTLARTTDAPLSVWAYCERAAVATEMAQRLPRAVLFSVAMVESGRFNAKTRKTRPWPWTINAEGKSYYLKSKSEAIAKVKSLQADGMRSIDVGCMQINLRYHPEAFANLEAAFDPIINVTYAAEFLKRLHGRTNSWPEAIAAYHSQTKTRSQPYFARVIDVWTDQHPRISKLARVLREQAKEQVAAQLRQSQPDPVVTARAEPAAAPAFALAATRPAPMVLGSSQGEPIHQTAGAGVGLRLSIAESDFADAAASPLPPRVMDAPSRANSTATILADASPTL